MAPMLTTNHQHHFSSYRPVVAADEPIVLCRSCQAAQRQARWGLRWLRSCGAKVHQCQCCGKPRETWVYLIAALPPALTAPATLEAR